MAARVVEARTKLVDAQLLVLNALCEDAIGLEKLLKEQLQDLLLTEESFYKQKSRIDWIKHQIFQKIVAAKRNGNQIRSISDDSGTKLTSFAAISEEIVNYFTSMLGDKDQSAS